MRPTPISRKTLLRAAAGTALTGVPLLAAAPAARADATALQAGKIADLTGPGITTRFGMEATDLGIPVRTPDGRLLFVFGDTFQNATVGGGWWRSPVALWGAHALLTDRVVWTGAVGGEKAQQLWAYEHDNPVFSTVLPSDVITIGGTIYLHAMVNKGLGNVVWTEIWRSDDSGATWTHTGAKFPSDLHSGLFQLFTWGLGNDGYAYVYSTGFQPDKPIILHRVPSARLTDLNAYEPWGWRDGAWAWGNPPTPDPGGEVRRTVPAAARRQVGLHLVQRRRLPHRRHHHGHPHLEPLHRPPRNPDLGQCLGSEDDTHVAQLYGGYVIPGSTLDDLHTSVSQWNTQTGWPYHVMQFRVRGFGG
ncbi:DUF4185 domain-containing protein [Streptomyces mirabilis]|uniref:DUF4185 domain-containing protein n=1 Tax=Streptomyces mirabilis TaxID=68239 RepID=UPI0036CE5800